MGHTDYAQPAVRVQETIDTGRHYGPDDPVLVVVIRRPHRITVGDDGGAVRRVGRPPGWRLAGERLSRELDVNVSRSGIVSLPVVAAGPPEEVVIARIGEASQALYQTLLDLVP